MATARAIFQAHVDDLLLESIPLDLQWVLANGVLEILPISLANGDNTISPPTNTALIVTIPPATNTNALKWKGAGGDTGTTTLPNRPDVRGYGGGTVILNAAGATAGVLLIFLG